MKAVRVPTPPLVAKQTQCRWVCSRDIEQRAREGLGSQRLVQLPLPAPSTIPGGRWRYSS
jgi:hypothetical protein